MTGAIRGWQVLGHPVLVVRIGGLRALLRCLLAVARHQHRTFLELVVAVHAK